jgi:UDP-N-acetylmuramoyl-tripeptide--D-alanyl-D-alanine ligase
MATPIPENRARFSLSEIATATAGQLIGADEQVTGVAIDSRAVARGGLFVAVRGDSHDGQAYVPAAVAAGSAGLLVSTGAPCADATPRVEVADTTRALGDLAAYHRTRWGGQVVAITGSAGKTTTKELTAAALGAAGARVLKTVGNLNNQFGVPMMIFCAGPEHDCAVLELGTSGPGEIARLGEIARPQVAVVLLAALAHTAGLKSLEAVADEKSALWGALDPGGIAIVNADDPELMKRVRSDVTTLSFGKRQGATVRLLSVELRGTRTSARIEVVGVGELELSLRLLGEAPAIDACAAIAAVLALHPDADRVASLHAAIAAIALVEPTAGRLACSETSAGVTLIDDSYNANPSSMALALETLVALAQQTGGRSLALLADMSELGSFSQVEHARIGELAVRAGVDVLVGAGPEMAHATSAAARISAGRLAPHPTRVAHVMTPIDAVSLVQSLCRKRDVVLIKGSRSMAMERVVAALMQKLGGVP